MTDPARGRVDATGRDCWFLVVLLVVATLVYLPTLGFYSDDWAFLGSMRTAGSSFADQYASLGDVRMRPVQGVLLAGVYHLVGATPLAFHVVNTGALIAGAVCFYLVLMELGLSRKISLAIPLVYAMLPHYSTDRFWIAAMQATVSMLCYFGSLYAELRAVRQPAARLRWLSLAAAAGVLCVLAYEVFLPLLLLNPLIAWLHARRRVESGDKIARLPGLLILMMVTVATLAPALIYKATVATRLGGSNNWGEHLQWLWWIYKGAIALAVNDFGIWLPRVGWRLWRDSASITALLVALVSGLLVYVYLARAGRTDREASPWRTGVGLFAAGIAVFVAGYAVFLLTKNAANTPAGIGNRVAIAAAAGIAMAWVGAAFLGTAWAPAILRTRLVAGGVAVLYATCVFINGTLATFWSDAYRREREVLVAIQREFPAFPGPGTLIIDGVCPYVGPAVVFESSWDLAGALQHLYGERGLQADIVTPNLTVTDTGLVASLYYGILVTSYPYDRMQMFNVRSGLRYPVPDAAAARRYLAEFNPDRRGGCPLGKPGEGVPVF